MRAPGRGGFRYFGVATDATKILMDSISTQSGRGDTHRTGEPLRVTQMVRLLDVE